MKNAFAGVALLAAWACATSCWGQGIAAAQASPAIQIDRLKAQVAKLTSENTALKARLAGMSAGSRADRLLADAERRILELTQENDALQTSLADTQGTLKQREEELSATQARLDEALNKVATLEATVTDLTKRVDVAHASIEDLKVSVDERNRSIDQLGEVIKQAGPPLWPWGAMAAAVALGVGAALTRWLWPKTKLVPVSQPLSVNVKLGEWLPKAALTGLTLLPSFSVRAELVPQFSSICPTREPLVHEIRDAARGAAP